MKLNMRLFGGLFLLIFSFPSQSQTISDSSFVAAVKKHIVNNYVSQLGSEAPIYNGKRYLPDRRLDGNGHAFFIDTEYTKGSVVYNGYLFKDVDLQYDLVHDQLVLLNFDKFSGIILKQTYVDSFNLRGHTFVNIRPTNTKRQAIQAGYFELLYSGKTNLLAKRTKTIVETTNQYEVKRLVEQQEFYYVHKNDNYIPIRNKKDLLNLFSSKRTAKESQRYLKSQHLNFRKDKEKAMIALLQWHDLQM
ncbi:hypothetical protein [Pelobium manganitolerans]|uniref:hypothetical protein n=1 Tax=Pelobium manganitolerans TaxID=1842495 RepID=UPI003FA35D80